MAGTKKRGGMLALAMLKASDIPPIQVEATFLYNPTRKKRKTGRDIYQDKMTSAIVSGINSRFATNFTLPHFRFVRNL